MPAPAEGNLEFLTRNGDIDNWNLKPLSTPYGEVQSEGLATSNKHGGEQLETSSKAQQNEQKQ